MPAASKLFTMLVHAALSIGHICLLRGSGGNYTVSPQLCGAHFASLIGLWGPESSWGVWWNPCPVYEPVGVALFMVMGVAEYIAIGMNAFDYYLYNPCDDELLGGLVQELSQNDNSDMSAAAFVNGSLAQHNCIVDADGNAVVAPCDACGCESCPAEYLKSWLDMLTDGQTVSISVAVDRELEERGCETRTDANNGDRIPIKRLSFVDQLWFCIVLLTTVGYGNTFVPTSTVCRHFVMIWSLLGLFIFGASWNSALQVLLKRPGNEAIRAKKPSQEADFSPPHIYYSGRALFLNFLAFLAINFGGALIFWHTEVDWKFSDGFYFCMMTATTIGLGDIAPTSQAGRAWGIAQMLLSVAYLGSLTGTVLAGLNRRAEVTKKEELLSKQLDEELIERLDNDNNGVDKAEFVLGMLQILGKVTEEDYAPFLAQFAELDKSGDGRLTVSDLSGLAQRNTERAKEEEREKAESLKTFQAKVQVHALKLLFPTFLACTAFSMNLAFGYILMGTGLVSALAIGSVISRPTTPRSYHNIAALVVVAGCGYAFGCAVGIVFVVDSRMYQDFDSYYSNIGPLDGNGVTTRASARYRESRIRHFDLNECALMIFCFYLIFTTIYASATCFMTAVCCVKAAKELQLHKLGDARTVPDDVTVVSVTRA